MTIRQPAASRPDVRLRPPQTTRRLNNDPPGVCPERAESPGEPAASLPGPGQQSILVVDDQPRIRELARVALSDCGYSVTTAASGREAAELVSAHPFALVISDYAMPEGGGLTLLAAVRRVHPELPFILWSATLPSDVRRRTRELRAECCDGKLVGIDLTRLVDTVLRPSY